MMPSVNEKYINDDEVRSFEFSVDSFPESDEYDGDVHYGDFRRGSFTCEWDEREEFDSSAVYRGTLLNVIMFNHPDAVSSIMSGKTNDTSMIDSCLSTSVALDDISDVSNKCDKKTRKACELYDNEYELYDRTPLEFISSSFVAPKLTVGDLSSQRAHTFQQPLKKRKLNVCDIQEGVVPPFMPPVLANQKCDYVFTVKAPIKELIDVVSETLLHQSYTFTFDSEQFVFEIEDAKNSELKLAIDLYSNSDEMNYTVEFRRMNGCCMAFRRVFRNLSTSILRSARIDSIVQS